MAERRPGRRRLAARGRAAADWLRGDRWTTAGLSIVTARSADAVELQEEAAVRRWAGGGFGLELLLRGFIASFPR